MTVIEPVIKRSKADVYAMVTDKIIEALEAGTVPWSQPWDSRIGLPLSMSTGKAYRGVNVWLLAITGRVRGYTSPYWATYDKITALGGQVRKGEKSTLVTFWNIKDRDVVTDGVVENKRFAMLRYYIVFNADQADGLPEKYMKAPEGHEHDPINEAQAVVDGYVNLQGPIIRVGNKGPTLTHSAGEGAYYAPFLDEIVLPPLAAFPLVEGYYSTAFHEMTHSTGHKSRLAREGITAGHAFADESYSKEELIAEMGAAMLCGATGIDQAVRDRSASYIQNWVTTLRGDSKLVIQAAGQAQKAADLILGTTFDTDEEDA